MISFVSFAFISALVFKISFLLLTLDALRYLTYTQLHMYLYYQTQVHLSLLRSVYLKDKCLWERKLSFPQEASDLGKRKTRVHEPALKILLDHEGF